MRKILLILIISITFSSCYIHKLSYGEGAVEGYTKTDKQHNFILGFISEETSILEEIKKEEEKTLEEELEEQLSDKEIENFQIEKVDMERLTNKVCDILVEHESNGMFQSELWKKLKLTSRDGSRLALKLERMGTITRDKLLENNRWTYKLILKKTPISTQSIVNAPCLVCPVEQKCSLEGEISPRSCQFIEDWVILEMKKPVKTK